MILAIFDLQIAPILIPTKFGVSCTKFGVSWRFGSEDVMFKIDFQDDIHNSDLGFLIRIFFAIFNLQVTAILPAKFPVKWPFVKEKFKTDLQDCGPGSQLGFPIRKILASFDLQVALILPTKF